MGAQLRRIRVLARVSLEDAAATAGVSPGMVSHYENGRVMPPPDKLAALARAYGMAPEELASHVDYPIAARVVRSLREWYDQRARESRYTSPPRDGETARDGGRNSGTGGGVAADRRGVCEKPRLVATRVWDAVAIPS